MEEALCTFQAQCMSTSNRQLNYFGGCHGHWRIFKKKTITKEPQIKPRKPQQTLKKQTETSVILEVML